MTKNLELNESIINGNTFFETVLPEILYNDRLTYEVIYGIIEDGPERIHGLLNAYCNRMNTVCPYDSASIKFAFAKEGEVITFRYELPEVSRVSKIYMFFELTEEGEIEALRYLYTLKDSDGKKCIFIDPDDFSLYAQPYEDELEEDVVENLYYENIALMVG